MQLTMPLITAFILQNSFTSATTRPHVCHGGIYDISFKQTMEETVHVNFFESICILYNVRVTLHISNVAVFFELWRYSLNPTR